MIYQVHCTLPNEILEQIASDELDALSELLRVLINRAYCHLYASQPCSGTTRRNTRSVRQAATPTDALLFLSARYEKVRQLIVSDAHTGLQEARHTMGS